MNYLHISHMDKLKTKPGYCFKLLFLILAIFINYSCEFNPTGSNNKNIKIEEPVAYMNLDFNSDTIEVWGIKNFNYSFDVGDRYVRSVKLFIDTILYKVEDNHSQQGNFNFNSEDYENGIHQLRFEVISSSGTGSIADELGAEYITFSKTWDLIIDNSPPIPISFTSIKPVDGRLKIEWEKYSKFNFQHYSIYVNDYQEVATINDKEINFWIDSNYVCGNINYRIDVSAANHTGVGATYNYSFPFPKVRLATSDSNKVTITWTKSILYNNFLNYNVYRSFNGNIQEKIATINTLNDTTLIDSDPIFGDEINYSVMVNYAWYNVYNDPDSSSLYSYIGTKMIPFNSIQYNASLNSLFISNPDGHYRLDPITLSILSFQSHIMDNWLDEILTVSQNGQYAYVSADNKIYKLNPISLAVENSISTKSITGYYSYISSSFQVSNSNLITYASCYKPNSTTYQLIGDVILDMNNNIVRDSLPKNESNFDCKISANGDYFYAHNTLYKISSQNLIKVGQITTYQFAFIDEGEKFIIRNNNTILLQNSNDMSTVLSINVNSPGKFSYDSQTSCLGVITGTDAQRYFIIFDLNSGKEVKRVHVFSNDFFYIANSILFSSGGYYLPLNLK